MTYEEFLDVKVGDLVEVIELCTCTLPNCAINNCNIGDVFEVESIEDYGPRYNGQFRLKGNYELKHECDKFNVHIGSVNLEEWM